MIPEQLRLEVEGLKGGENNIEIVLQESRVYIVFKNFKLPLGLYNANTTELLVWTTTAYPSANFDMFWTSPELKLVSGGEPQSASHFEMHLNKNWRRFSIHPYNVNAWNPNEDNLISYLTHVNHRLHHGK